MLLPRNQIPVEHTWDLGRLFRSTEDWDAAVEDLNNRLLETAAYQGRLAEGPTTLVDALDDFQSTMLDGFRIGMYAFLSYSVDTNDQGAGARTGQATSLSSRVRAALAFVEPELMAVGFDTLSDWIEREPRLAQYRHYFDKLERRQAHVRSAEVEELLGSVRAPFTTASETHGILANADLEFEPAWSSDGTKSFDVAQSTIGSLVNHADRNVRRSAWQNYADAHLAHKNSMNGSNRADH